MEEEPQRLTARRKVLSRASLYMLPSDAPPLLPPPFSSWGVEGAPASVLGAGGQQTRSDPSEVMRLRSVASVIPRALGSVTSNTPFQGRDGLAPRHP